MDEEMVKFFKGFSYRPPKSPKEHPNFQVFRNNLETPPPIDIPFLGYTENGWEMMEWKQRNLNGKETGWYGIYIGCSCCSCHCEMNFEYWMNSPLDIKDMGPG